MKWFIITIITTIIISTFGCATRPFEGWSTEDTVRQVIYSAVHVADWSQTVKISNSDGEFVELNPFLGESPSESSVHLYMGGTLILQTLIPAMLKPEYRKWYQTVWIGLESATVVHNYSIGIKTEF